MLLFTPITSGAASNAHAPNTTDGLDENGGVVKIQQEVNAYLHADLFTMSSPEEDVQVEELRNLLEHALQNTYRSRENDQKVTEYALPDSSLRVRLTQPVNSAHSVSHSLSVSVCHSLTLSVSVCVCLSSRL